MANQYQNRAHGHDHVHVPLTPGSGATTVTLMDEYAYPRFSMGAAEAYSSSAVPS